MNGDLLAILEYWQKEKGIEKETLIKAVESAVLSASKKAIGPAKDLRIEIDRKSGEIRAFAKVTVVENVRQPHEEISLQKAQAINPNVPLGESVEIEVTPQNFGRIAAQTAKQAMLQKIRQAEKDLIYEDFKDRVGDIVSGSVTRFERSDVIVNLGRTEAVLPARERVTTEEYQTGERIRAYVLNVNNESHGAQVVLSRSHPNFVKRLFELEVSEIADKTVEIKGISREAGFRTKIAVYSKDEKVDPVGACVGMRGARVKNIVRELNNEKIDIIRWDKDIKTYVTNALSPARLRSVEIYPEEQRVLILVDEDQLSLAIGKRGQNARLTAKLIGWRVDIEKVSVAPQLGFAEQVANAVAGLEKNIKGLDHALAEKLVHGGFSTAEAIATADLDDLQQVAGIDADQAQKIKDSVNPVLENSATDHES